MSTIADATAVLESTEVIPHTPADLPALDGPRTLRPSDAGRRMSFEDFVLCDFEDGHSYELARGIVVVAEVPGIPHGRIRYQVTRLFVHYDDTHPGVINYQASGAGCRIRLPAMKCDRHPDHAVYLLPPPDTGPRVWNRWVPDLVVEIVSEGGEERDYAEKREESLKAGVREYWILDRKTRILHALQRAGDVWEEVTVTADETYACPLLPGLMVRASTLFGPAIPA